MKKRKIYCFFVIDIFNLLFYSESAEYSNCMYTYSLCEIVLVSLTVYDSPVPLTTVDDSPVSL